MNFCARICFYFATIILPKLVTSARILAIFPVGARSHFMMNTAITESLHDVGHHVTVVSPFPWKSTSANYTILDSRSDVPIFAGENEVDLEAVIQPTVHSFTQFLIGLEEKHCHHIIKMPPIQEALSMADSKPYDLLIVELFLMFECYLPIAEKLNIPVIGTATTKTWKPAEYAVGVPNNPASIPLEMIDSSVEMTFFQRLTNALYNVVFAYDYIYFVASRVENFRREYFTEEVVSDKKVSLLFMNSHFTLLPRPLPPNVIEIGGIHIKSAQPLNEDLKQFIEEAEHGVILFSLGSLIKGSSIPTSSILAFVDAFETLPQRVIWKYDAPIDNLPGNVRLQKWIPQRDILEHRNVRAFISHCGQHSAFEAIHTGTPVVAVPLVTDQYSTAAILQAQGVAIAVDIHTVTKELISRTLNTIINDPKYISKMQELRRIFNDRPMSPQQAVVFWTEYVLRHQGALHLRTNASDIPLYQYLLLDVISVGVIIVITIVYLILVVGRRIIVGLICLYHFMCSPKKKKKCS